MATRSASRRPGCLGSNELYADIGAQGSQLARRAPSCSVGPMPRRALIMGIGGQDGSYLAELLLAKGYDVDGMVRRGSTGSLNRIAHIARDISIHAADLHDMESPNRTIRESRPDEVYNLAG